MCLNTGEKIISSRQKTETLPLLAAAQRLDAAVARLENATRSSDRLAGPRPGELIEALESAQNENANLQENVETVSVRLDGAIGRLRAVLGA